MRSLYEESIAEGRDGVKAQLADVRVRLSGRHWIDASTWDIDKTPSDTNPYRKGFYRVRKFRNYRIRDNPCTLLSYFNVTVRVACPPRLLRTVMFCGFVDQENSPRYRPPPSLRRVPIRVFVDVT